MLDKEKIIIKIFQLSKSIQFGYFLADVRELYNCPKSGPFSVQSLTNAIMESSDACLWSLWIVLILYWTDGGGSTVSTMLLLSPIEISLLVTKGSSVPTVFMKKLQSKDKENDKTKIIVCNLDSIMHLENWSEPTKTYHRTIKN